jgi:hypothetical protein
VKGEEGLFFALKREIKWAELRLILEGWRGNGKQEVKKGEEKMKDMHDYVLVIKYPAGTVCVDEGKNSMLVHICLHYITSMEYL